MYDKDKNVKFTIRLSDDDFKYLLSLSDKYNVSISQVLRSIISSFRIGGFTDGYTKTFINH